MPLPIPPPVLVVLFAAVMWQIAERLPFGGFAFAGQRPLAALLLLAGVALMAAATWTMFRARTTVNPLRPERASALVDGGIYQYTRNPMYLGFATVLVAWSLALASPLAMLGVAAFVLYMNRFQISPEERALATLFGEEFIAYRSRVRRWL